MSSHAAVLDTRRRVETPEGVELDLAVAGPVSRASAWLIDSLIRIAVWFAVSVALVPMGPAGQGLALVAFFLLGWGYPVLFELVNHGATPGKSLLGLEVVHDDGTPVRLSASVVRNLLRAVDALPVAYAFGLAAPFGIASTTGVAGLTLGGGMGYLTRRCGLSCDNLLSADVVTADGAFVTCSADREADLFWALRGGGGNFGVVTSFEFRLHPIADIFGGPIFFPLDGDVVSAYRDFIVDAPEELGALFAFTMAPPLPFLPAEVHGKPIVMVGACYAGSPEDGIDVVQPLKEFGRPIVDLIEPKPYLTLQSMFDKSAQHGWHYHWKSLELPPLTDGAIDTLVEHASALTSPKSYCIVFQLGGALGRVGPEQTAYSQRDGAHNVNINAVWTEDDPDPDPGPGPVDPGPDPSDPRPFKLRAPLVAR